MVTWPIIAITSRNYGPRSDNNGAEFAGDSITGRHVTLDTDLQSPQMGGKIYDSFDNYQSLIKPISCYIFQNFPKNLINERKTFQMKRTGVAAPPAYCPLWF